MEKDEHDIKRYFKITTRSALHRSTVEREPTTKQLSKTILKILGDDENASLKCQNISKVDIESCQKIASESVGASNSTITSEYRRPSLRRARKLVNSVLKAPVPEEALSTNRLSKRVAKRLAARKRLFTDQPSENAGIMSSPLASIISDPLPHVPAFKRFSSLIDDTHNVSKSAISSKKDEFQFSTNFPLPPSYEKLYQFYKSTDSVLYLLYQRKEQCSFHQLKTMVEAVTKKNFEHSDLAKIVTLRPVDFKFHLNQNLCATNGLLNNNDRKTPVLMVAPNYSEALKQLSVSTSPVPVKLQTKVMTDSPIKLSPLKRNLFSSQFSPSTNPLIYSPAYRSTSMMPPLEEDTFKTPANVCEKKKVVRPSHLTWRRDQMHNALLECTHRQHKVRLLELGLNDCLDNYSSVRRWHPDFDLEGVESIKESVLLEDLVPKDSMTTLSAKDILSNTKLKLNGVMVRALGRIVQDVTSESSVDSATIDSDNSSGVSLKSLNSRKTSVNFIPQELLKRIRQREKEKAQRQLIADSSEMCRLEILKKLPSLLKIMFNYLRTERKTCMLFSKVVEKMVQSTTFTLSAESMEEHIIKLSQVVPDLVTIPIVNNTRFVKLVQIKCSLDDALSQIEGEIKRIKP